MSWWHDDRTDRDYGQVRGGGGGRPDRYSGYDVGYQRDRRMRSPPRRDYYGGGGSGGGGGGRVGPPLDEDSGRRVYVHNLSYRTSWQDLKDFMRKAGAVEHVRVMEDRYGRSLGCAIVEYATKENARRAIKELNDTIFEEGRSILVREDREGNKRRNPPHMGGRGYGGGPPGGGYSGGGGGGGGAYRQVYGGGGGGGGYGGGGGGGYYERGYERPYSSGGGGGGYERGGGERGGYGDRYRSRSRSRSPRRRGGMGGRTKEQLDMELDGFEKSRKDARVP